MNPRRVGKLFAVGAVVGTLGDLVHTHWGVVAYPHPALAREAWWVPLLMGTAGVVFVTNHGALAARLGDRGRATPRDAAVALAWFAGCYLASGVLRAYPFALTVAFLAAFVARALGPSRSRALVPYAVLTAAGGVALEVGLSATGAYRHLHPDVAGVPWWLGGLYLHAALAARAIDRCWPA